MNRFELFLKYFLVTLCFCVIYILNYFNDEVYDTFPFLPPEVILITSLSVILLTGHLLWWREREVDNIKYQFLTIATHKFRTPLTAIKWITGALAKEVTREEKLNYLKQIDVSANRLMEVVDILTGLARFDHKLQYAYETAWLRQMIDVALDKYVPKYREKNITFVINSDPEIPLVIIDKRKIQFVVDTLFENAIHYSPVGSQVEVSLTKTEHHVLLSVKDSGIGIKKEDQKRLFRRFWRSDESKASYPDGMGLSLAMVSEIVRKHGGRVWAESKGKGRGTTFFVKLKIGYSREKIVSMNKVQV